jgi:hypothetical protein
VVAVTLLVLCSIVRLDVLSILQTVKGEAKVASLAWVATRGNCVRCKLQRDQWSQQAVKSYLKDNTLQVTGR